MQKSERQIARIADGFSFLEAPRWHEGRLFLSDFYTHRVLAVDEVGRMETICTVAEQPSGLGFGMDGSLHVVSMRDRRLLKRSGSRLIEVADLSGFTPFWCNDMVVDTQGRAYIGNFGWDVSKDIRDTMESTRLAMVRPDGSVSAVAEDVMFPNGIVLAPDGATLYVAETFAARISAFDVAEDGSLSNRRVWASFSERQFESVATAVASGVPLPDGMALDAEGCMWIGDATGRGPLRVAEGGKILDRVTTGNLATFAVALGGADRRTLYMCASPPLLSNDPSTDHRACLLSCSVDAPGAGLP